MEGQTSEFYWEQFQLIIFYGLLAIFVNWMARKRGFYRLPAGRAPLKISLKSVIVVFAIYLTSMLILATFLSYLIKTLYSLRNESVPADMAAWLQLVVLMITALFFYLYSSTQDATTMQRLWKDRTIPNLKSISSDVWIGLFTWVLGFPVVIVLGQLSDTLLTLFFGTQTYEQVAISYLKMNLLSPAMLFSALFTILVAAPFIEEFLFRGFLQNYLKRHMSIRSAIILTSIAFALFHLAPSQGLGNVSLAVSLFTFSLFLGFIYEKQASIFASVSLHIVFNAFSTLRVIFLPDQ